VKSHHDSNISFRAVNGRRSFIFGFVSRAQSFEPVYRIMERSQTVYQMMPTLFSISHVSNLLPAATCIKAGKELNRLMQRVSCMYLCREPADNQWYVCIHINTTNLSSPRLTDRRKKWLMMDVPAVASRCQMPLASSPKWYPIFLFYRC